MTGEIAARLPRLSPALARILPFGLYIVFLAVGPWVAPLLPDARWLYPVQVGCVALALALLAPHFTELRGTWRVSAADWPLALAVGVAVFVIWINLDQPWASLGTAHGFDPRTAEGGIDWPLAGLRIAGAALVVPVMEELFWRSFIMRWIEQSRFLELSPGQVAGRGLLFSSLLFGVEHNLWFAGIVAGLAYAWLYRRRVNLWTAVIAHAVSNFLLGLWVLYSGNWQFW
jgi:CAAX prenyl protease-like protein